MRVRVITALVLMPLILGVTAYGSTRIFAALCAYVVLVGMWEWVGLAGLQQRRWKILVLSLTTLLMAACYLNMNPVLLLLIVGTSLVWWGIALVLIIRRQRGRDFNPMLSLQTVMGVVVLVPAWVFLVALHADPVLGGPMLVSCLFVLIWAADIGAYYVGQRWGRNKLASLISPGKTWEGIYGANVSGLLAGAACFLLLLQMTLDKFALFLLICFVTINMSVVGDLAESMVKRRRGVKDSGELFPGHGGALDRIDSLTAAAPVFFSGVWFLGRIS